MEFYKEFVTTFGLQLGNLIAIGFSIQTLSLDRSFCLCCDAEVTITPGVVDADWLNARCVLLIFEVVEKFCLEQVSLVNYDAPELHQFMMRRVPSKDSRFDLCM